MDLNPYSAPTQNADNSAWLFDKRWLVAVPLLGAVAIFALLHLMLVLLCLFVCNAIAFVVLLIVRQKTAAILALLTGALLVATLLFTNWGFSMPNPKIRVSWVFLVPSCVSQLALILTPLWLPRLKHIL